MHSQPCILDLRRNLMRIRLHKMCKCQICGWLTPSVTSQQCACCTALLLYGGCIKGFSPYAFGEQLNRNEWVAMPGKAGFLALLPLQKKNPKTTVIVGMRAEAPATPLPESDRCIGYFHCSREPEPAEVTFRKGRQLWLFYCILFTNVFCACF